MIPDYMPNALMTLAYPLVCPAEHNAMNQAIGDGSRFYVYVLRVFPHSVWRAAVG